MDQCTGSFRAVSDDGHELTVLEFRNIKENRFLNGPPTIRKGLPRYELDDGSSLTPAGVDAFKIVATDEVIRLIG